MFMMKLFKAFSDKKIFYLNNFGNHSRDFTYIEDVTEALIKLIRKKLKAIKYLIFVQTSLKIY